jgi:ubiquinone/menaquinone biosynthesis C-methylase UbiE
MGANDMRIADSDSTLVTKEPVILNELLPLDGAKIVELGCGKAEMTRIASQQAESILALEVDEIQLAKNRSITDLANVIFEHGGAEKIPAPDSGFDIVLMLKSLHHVPSEFMDNAFDEIRRVLKPGGLAYISEPVYAGDFNEILRLFHDEKEVREAAFAAIQRAVATGHFELVTERCILTVSASMKNRFSG